MLVKLRAQPLVGEQDTVRGVPIHKLSKSRKVEAEKVAACKLTPIGINALNRLT